MRRPGDAAALLRAALVACTLAGALVGALSGCSQDGGGSVDRARVERIGVATTRGEAKTGQLVASAQRSDGRSVVVDRVSMPQAGYVVVYADGNGAPGQRLGVSSLLQKGFSKNVVVRLAERLADGAQVHAMLHGEDNGNTTFDFPGHDAPLSSGGGIVEAAVKVRVG